MALVDYQSNIIKYVADEIAGVPAALLKQVARDVVREFCISTQMWQEDARPIDLTAQRDRYAVQPNATDREISKIVRVFTESTDEKMHDGSDYTAWTASAGQGTWDFADATEAYEDGQSIDFASTVDTDYAELTREADLSMTDYGWITGAIKLSAWVSGTDDIALQWYLDGSTTGSSVNLSSYIDIENTSSWQTFSIAKADFGTLTSVDKLRITIANAPNGNLDDIYLARDPKGGKDAEKPFSDYIVEKYKTIKLNQRPKEDDPQGLRVIVSYFPSETGDNIPEWIWNNWRQCFAHGVKSKLFMQASNTWYNPEMARFHTSSYNAQLRKARVDMNKELTHGVRIVDLKWGRK
jgi:hypothetical protein